MKIEINIDDKLIAKVRRFFSRRNVIVIFVSIFMMSVVLYAADRKFTIFQPRVLIRSAELNDNFMLMPPVGSIVAFAGLENKIPNGWLICDGRTLNKDDYNELFEAIDIAWGQDENDPDRFHLPDLRGRFLRGVDKTGINDEDSGNRRALYGGNTGNNVGSYQEDAIRNIKGYFNGNVNDGNNWSEPFYLHSYGNIGSDGDGGGGLIGFDASLSVPTVKTTGQRMPMSIIL